MNAPHPLPDPGVLSRLLLDGKERVLVVGESGTGTSTLVERVADEVAAVRGRCPVLTADLGQPLFGPPGAAALASRRDGRWIVAGIAGLGTLDAARFRLPLVEAVRRLAALVPDGPLLVDAPGVFRGMAASELLPGLCRAAAVDRVLVLLRGGRPPSVLDDLRATGAMVDLYRAPTGAAAGSQRRRVARRGTDWRRWLEGAQRQVLDLERLPAAGAPPPRSAPREWRGRQAVVLGEGGATLGIGEVVELAGSRLEILAPPLEPGQPSAVLVRDARRGEGGTLGTAARVAPSETAPPSASARGPIGLPPPAGRCVTDLRGTLVGGLLGDPLVVLRQRTTGHHLLLDLGEHFELPVRVAHRTTDVFLTHGHLDHVAGFVWLLRRRIGLQGVCRVWGPAGTAAAVDGFVRAVTWDRIGDEGPRFEIAELGGGRLRRWALRVGRNGPVELEDRAVRGGVILREPELEVRATVLEHGTPVLAYAIQEPSRLSVRPDRVAGMGLAPGPWVGRMKELIRQGRRSEPVLLPEGRELTAGELASELVEERPGQKLVYACDLADTATNREALIALAEGAQLLLCEAAFAEADRERAAATGHLTARACGEIAAAARVERLLPFHLSARYQGRPEEVISELREVFDRVWLPRTIAVLGSGGGGHDLAG